MKLLLTTTYLLLTILASAQDIDFTQWQANYTALNPAMTGISNNPRLHFANRSIHSGLYRAGDISPYARTILASYDQRLSPKAGYIGVSYLDDVIGEARIGTKAVSLQYARNYSIDIVAKANRKTYHTDGKLNLRVGISIAGHQRSVNGAWLRQEKLYQPRTGIYYDGHHRAPAQTLYTNIAPNFGAGIALNYENTYSGFAIHNIIQPMDAFTGNPTTRMPRRYSANIGTFIPLNKENPKSLIIAPSFVYQRQNSITDIMPGININKGIFTGGISYRYKDVGNLSNETSYMNFVLGISKGRFKGAYNYETMLDGAFITSHEFSLSFYLGKTHEESKNGIPYYFRKMGF